MTEEIDAGAKLALALDRSMSVKAAFWIKASEVEQRYLYLASDRIDDTNFDLAYGEVLRIWGETRSPHLDPFRVKVIRGDDPLGVAAADINRRFPGPMPTRLGGTSFGGLAVDDVYIYPSPLPTTAS